MSSNNSTDKSRKRKKLSPSTKSLTKSPQSSKSLVKPPDKKRSKITAWFKKTFTNKSPNKYLLSFNQNSNHPISRSPLNSISKSPNNYIKQHQKHTHTSPVTPNKLIRIQNQQSPLDLELFHIPNQQQSSLNNADQKQEEDTIQHDSDEHKSDDNVVNDLIPKSTPKNPTAIIDNETLNTILSEHILSGLVIDGSDNDNDSASNNNNNNINNNTHKSFIIGDGLKLNELKSKLVSKKEDLKHLIGIFDNADNSNSAMQNILDKLHSNNENDQQIIKIINSNKNDHSLFILSIKNQDINVLKESLRINFNQNMDGSVLILDFNLNQNEFTNNIKNNRNINKKNKTKKKRKSGKYAQTYSKKEALAIIKEKHQNCIQQQPQNDNKYICTICFGCATALEIEKYAYNGKDALADGGSERCRGDRAMRHVEGQLHKLCIKKRQIKSNPHDPANEWNAIMIKWKKADYEILIVDVLTVYSDCKRGTISANSWPLRKSMKDVGAHWIRLNKNEYKQYNPSESTIKYTNPSRYTYYRSFIAEEINRNHVVKPIIQALGRNHKIDGWDHKGEKYNNLIRISDKYAHTNIIWLGLITPSGYGAVGELEAMLQSYSKHKIDISICRPDSMTYDSPSIHTGKKGGLGKLYSVDCKENGFKWDPIKNICAGHNGQNASKDFYNTNRTSKNLHYYPCDERLLELIEIKDHMKTLIYDINKSNYFAMFIDWCVKELGINELKLKGLSKLKEIRLADHVFTSMKDWLRDLVCILLWFEELLTTKSQRALKQMAFKHYTYWSNKRTLKLYHLNLEHMNIFNQKINLFFQNQNKEGWIGNILDHKNTIVNKS